MSTKQSGENTNGGEAEGAKQGSRLERTQMPLTREEAEKAASLTSWIARATSGGVDEAVATPTAVATATALLRELLLPPNCEQNTEIERLRAEVNEKQRIIDSLMKCAEVYDDNGVSFRYEWHRREQLHRIELGKTKLPHVDSVFELEPGK